MHVKKFRYRSGTFGSVRQSIIRRVHSRAISGGGRWALFVNPYVINDNISTAKSFGTCIVNVLCDLKLKYCKAKVFIVERNT